MKKITIAIDGFSSCGKSTMAKQLARQIGYIYVDSGAMYRAITLFALRNNIFSSTGIINESKLKKLLPSAIVSFKINQDTHLPETYLNNECVEQEIRNMEVSSHVSAIAGLPFVREALVAQQQRMGEEKGIIMDGRDIGTTVFPDAELKIFVTASAEVRARRRYEELQAKGQNVPYEDVLKNVTDRDYLDTHREVSPLRQAEDAILLDNGNLTREQQLDRLIQLYHETTENA